MRYKKSYYQGQHSIDKHLNDMQNKLIHALDYPEYVCPICEPTFHTMHSPEMIEHFHTMHFLDKKPHVVSKEDQQTPSYVLLSYLVFLFEHGDKRRTLKISNKELTGHLIQQLKIDVSNQKPTYILKKLGFQKHTGYDATGARVFYINLHRLKNAVRKTTFDDLKYRLGLIDENKIIVEPLRPPSKQEQKDDTDTEGSGTFRDFIL